MSSERPDPSRPEEPDPGLDIDAAFAQIVAHWEPSAPDVDLEFDLDLGVADPDLPGEAAKEVDPPQPPAGTTPDPTPAVEPPADRLRGLFQPSWSDPVEAEPWVEEDHFVPPPPPPLPQLDPRRKVAWGALVGTPVLGLLLLLLGWGLPSGALVGLVAAFVGGFVYLVATMPSRGDDGWSGDDGAVV